MEKVEQGNLTQYPKENDMSGKQVKRMIEEKMNFDSVTVRNEVVICKRSYFYHHGVEVGNLAKSIKYILPQVEILEARDYFKRWPATSYMEVRCKFPVL